jgi:hypothetical protein
MKFRQLITAVSIAMLPLVASAATMIIPAAGTGPGVNNSRWQSELTFHNLSSSSITVGMTFHDSNGAGRTDSVTLNPRSTVTISDIVATRFGVQAGTGAIELTVPDAMADRVVVNSRTFNSSSAGQFGQDVPAINAADAASAGDIVVLQTPSSATESRFNFGIYAVTDAKAHWELIRADGTLALSFGEQTYAAGTQFQYNNGIVTLLGSTEENDDALHLVVTSGNVIAYGSAINNASGDPSYVPGIRARSDIRVNFVGVDIAGNGTIDAADANHDGVLDQPIDLWLSGFPTYFRVVAKGPNGEAVTLSLIDPPDDARFVTTDAVEWYPNPNEGPMTTLKVLATYAGGSQVLTIPVHLH